MSRIHILCALCLAWFGNQSILAFPILRVGSAPHSPPYVLQAQNRGEEIDRIQEFFQSLQLTPDWIFAPAKRLPYLLKRQDIDASLRASCDTPQPGFFISKAYMTMQNIAVATDPQISLESFADLSRYKVFGFHRAREFLGPDYAKAVAQSPLYLEFADQQRQVDVLFRRESSIIVLDELIFRHLKLKQYPKRDYRIFHIFPPHKICAIFRSRYLRDRFNAYFQKEIEVDPEFPHHTEPQPLLSNSPGSTAN